jgi:hypothetical protein
MFDDWAEEIEESRQETKRHRPYRMDREKKKGLMD